MRNIAQRSENQRTYPRAEAASRGTAMNIPGSETLPRTNIVVTNRTFSWYGRLLSLR
jgi:hypothetical protein